MPDKLLLFCSVNFLVFSSRISFARFLNSNLNLSCIFSNSPFCSSKRSLIFLRSASLPERFRFKSIICFSFSSISVLFASSSLSRYLSFSSDDAFFASYLKRNNSQIIPAPSNKPINKNTISISLIKYIYFQITGLSFYVSYFQ